MNRRGEPTFALWQVIRVDPLPVVVEAPQKEIHEPAWSHWRRDGYPAIPMPTYEMIDIDLFRRVVGQ